MDIKIKTGNRSDPRKGCSLLLFSSALRQILFYFFLCAFLCCIFCLIRVRLPTALPLIRASLSFVGCLLWREVLWSVLNWRLWACGHWHGLDRPKEKDPWLATLWFSDTYSLLRSSYKVPVSENEGRQWWLSTTLTSSN